MNRTEDIPATGRKVSTKELGAEPFRLFFPAAVLAGIAGTLLWPLHLWKIAGAYPGPAHAHLMVCGFFGAFILGFLGTSLPRMLGAPPLALWQTVALLGVHVALVVAFVLGQLVWGNGLFILLLLGLAGILASRWRQRRDTPPPGFVLIGLALACALSGAVLTLRASQGEMDPAWINLQKLLTYQGFVLFPILGVGPFILPRLFGSASTHDLPESAPAPPAGWWRRAGVALVTGLLILVSFALETLGYFRSGHVVRWLAVAGYFWIELPALKVSTRGNFPARCVQVALGGVVLGYAAVALWPQYRISLLHLTLVGGFAVVTLVVGARVAFGHGGRAAELRGRKRWFQVVLGLALLAMVTRISGDFWPKIQASHYSYGALLWIAGLIVWSLRVLPLITWTDDS